MGEAEDRLEIDRVTNLITGFGWRVAEQRFTDDKIVMTIEKQKSPSAETEAAPPG